jgi:uncharacterized membrane protein YphA (DoxX/SURF4 family)
MRRMRRYGGVGPVLSAAIYLAILLTVVVVIGTDSPSAFAHVRYILNQTEINQIEAGQPPGHLAQADLLSLLFLVAMLALVAIQFLGAYQQQKGRFKGLIMRLAKYSPYVPLLLRVLTGTFLVVSGYDFRLLAPEFGLPAGNIAPAIAGLEIVAGILLILGLFVKLAAIFIISLLGLAVETYGLHVLDHLELLGISVVLVTEGGVRYAVDGFLLANRKVFSRIARRLVKLKPFSMPALRITFGIAIIWLGLTEKLLAPELTAAAIAKYSLPVFPSVDLFIFLFGAFEIILGIHFLLGIFLRMISVIYLGLLVFAFFFFGESISHFPLFAVVLSILIRGSGPYTLRITFHKEANPEDLPEEELRTLSE